MINQDVKMRVFEQIKLFLFPFDIVIKFSFAYVRVFVVLLIEIAGTMKCKQGRRNEY